MACTVYTDIAIRLEVDGLAMGSSASMKKSWSLELFLALHTACGARLGAAAQLDTRCAMRPPIDAVQAHMVWRCTAEGVRRWSQQRFRTEPASRPPRMCRLTSVPRKCGGYFPEAEHAKVAHSPFTGAARPCQYHTGSAHLEFQLPYENMTMARRGGYLIETYEVMPLKRQRGTSKANIYITSKYVRW